LFSYRHAFHAGNHADVLKHAVFIHILDYFNRKDTPYWIIDTHAGAGLYDLRSDWTTQSGEVTDGLDRVLRAAHPPPLIERYLQEIQRLNPDGVANYYPGSPWLALSIMRSGDKLHLFELHPTEIDVLKRNLAHQGKTAQRQTTLYAKDGFDGMKGLLPPLPRRGISIIDPSYESKQDYRRVLQAVNDGLKRFATGCFVVWYPQVQRREAHEMARALERLSTPWVHAALTVKKPGADGFGLHGSGVFVLNPPWTLYKELQAAMPWLEKQLAQDDRAGHALNQNAG
jgi:23S rRNA (adenine2030-N6)-methyltransferase